MNSDSSINSLELEQELLALLGQHDESDAELFRLIDEDTNIELFSFLDQEELQTDPPVDTKPPPTELNFAELATVGTAADVDSCLQLGLANISKASATVVNFTPSKLHISMMTIGVDAGFMFCRSLMNADFVKKFEATQSEYALKTMDNYGGEPPTGLRGARQLNIQNKATERNHYIPVFKSGFQITSCTSASEAAKIARFIYQGIGGKVPALEEVSADFIA